MTARSLATRRVMKTLARRSAHNALPVRAADGSHPLVIALPEDKLVDVARHVKNEFGGEANIFVTLPDHIALIAFSFGPDPAEAEKMQRAHGNTSMAMYVAFLKMNDGSASLTLDMADASTGVQDIAYAF